MRHLGISLAQGTVLVFVQMLWLRVPEAIQQRQDREDSKGVRDLFTPVGMRVRNKVLLAVAAPEGRK